MKQIQKEKKKISKRALKTTAMHFKNQTNIKVNVLFLYLICNERHLSSYLETLMSQW